MTGLTVLSDPEGYFVVTTDGVSICGPFVTNAAAWREIERLEHEPSGRRENAADWAAGQWLRRE